MREGGRGRGEEIKDPRAFDAGTDGGYDTLCLVLVGVASRQVVQRGEHAKLDLWNKKKNRNTR